MKANDYVQKAFFSFYPSIHYNEDNSIHYRIDCIRLTAIDTHIFHIPTILFCENLSILL